MSNLGHYRKYNFTSLKDLLRVIRNKHNHFREMPTELRELLSPQPDGFLWYSDEHELHHMPRLHPALSAVGILEMAQL